MFRNSKAFKNLLIFYVYVPFLFICYFTPNICARLAQDRVQWRASVNTIMNLRVPYESRTFFEGLTNISFSNNVLHHEVSK
jgi:hypothetical protein